MNSAEESPQQWVTDLSEALRRWCETHGVTQTELADPSLLNMTRSTKEAIFRGTHVVGDADPTVYARIYYWTDLEEANPTRIPPRKYSVGEKSGEIARAWSVNKYMKWRKKPEARRLAQMKGVSGDVLEHRHELESPTWQNTPRQRFEHTSNLLFTSLRMLLDEIAVQAFGEEQQTDDSGKLAIALLNSLQSVVSGTSQDRDRWVSENRETLGVLGPLLEILMQRPETRESALETFLDSQEIWR